ERTSRQSTSAPKSRAESVRCFRSVSGFSGSRFLSVASRTLRFVVGNEAVCRVEHERRQYEHRSSLSTRQLRSLHFEGQGFLCSEGGRDRFQQQVEWAVLRFCCRENDSTRCLASRHQAPNGVWLDEACRGR